jgi:DNA-binding PadR family transcriptional regulator
MFYHFSRSRRHSRFFNEPSEAAKDGEGGRHGRGMRGHGRGFGRHGGGRDGGGRVFDHGELRLVILALIAEKPRHGYELIKAIEERLGGSYSPSPGVIYPTLTMLEDLGHASVDVGDGGRKLYTITEAGTQFLAANEPAVSAVMARMAEAGAARSSFLAPEIIRAMENLKLALRMRTSRGKLTEAELDAIATALDSAARAVERA